MKRSVVATIQLKISNLVTDMEVSEWNLNIPYAEIVMPKMLSFLENANDENDPSKSYSLKQFIRGIGQGGVANYQPKPNYILISKSSM